MEGNSFTSITSLPDEIISLILLNNEPQDIIHFGATCKQFHEVVANDASLWKEKYSQLIPSDVVKLVNEHGGCNWLKETIRYYKLKQTVCMKLISMSPEYYWRINEISFQETKEFFSMIVENNVNYYIIVYILQDIIKKGNSIIDSQQCLKPLYTLTVLHYAKLVLRCLIHTYLAIKWIQKCELHQLTPLFVTAFFIQWVDVTKMFIYEELEHKVDSVVKKVENILKRSPNPSSKLTRESVTRKYPERQLLKAITQAVYNYERTLPVPVAVTLKTVEVLEEMDGNVILYGTVYEAVAKRFGLNCNLIAFPKHIFLEWRSNEEPNNPMYNIDLFTGELTPKRRCPFSHGGNYKYNPDSLLQYFYDSYTKSKGYMKDFKSHNAVLLWDFFGNSNSCDQNPYKTIYMYLTDHIDSPAMRNPVNLKYMEDVHLDMLSVLAALLGPSKVVSRKRVTKKRHNTVMYSVGMICYHRTLNYTCVIRDWESDGYQKPMRPDVGSLQYGQEQPFYCVLAVDKSKRFVAQENLQAFTTPNRLVMLEEKLAKEFTHFDGFSYIPNEEKLVEYPEELIFIAAFKSRFARL